ncbi:MAG: AI-2E family transporter [Desulfobacterales bacterium]|nr:AI-2E family transporter [Desulfobacterales bacterium]
MEQDMRYFSFLTQDTSAGKTFITLIRIIAVLLIVMILMNGGAVVVSLAKNVYQAIETIFVSLLLAIVLFYVFNPIAVFLESFNIPRTLSIIIIYLAAAASLGALFGTIIPTIERELSSLQQELPKYQDKIVKSINCVETWIRNKSPQAANIDLSAALSSVKRELLGGSKSHILISSSKMIGSFVTLLVMVPFISFFFLKDGPAMKKALIGAVPNRYFEMSLNLFYEINRQLGGFVRARLVEALCVGLTCFIGLTLLGIKYAVVLAVIAALTNLIPYVGPIIGTIPALIIAFVDTGSVMMLLWVGMVYGIAQLLDTLVIIPAVFSKIVNMHPLVVVVVIIAGGQLGGVLGMIFAVPIYSITKVAIKEIHTGLSSLRA